MKKPETKKAKKAREIAERKAAKAAAKEAEHNKIFATPLAKAVAPLKIRAIANAEIEAKKYIENKYQQLEAAGWDINKVAPAPNSLKESRDTYRMKSNFRSSFECLTSFERKNGEYNSWRDMTLPRIVKKDQELAARFIKRSKELAASQYESFVYKMVRKVGDHKAAELDDMYGVWGYSHLHITKEDGTKETWQTKEIINCSVYGKLFNQWPSRKLKES